ARISMESGTENMDWIGRVLRRIIEFTQAGGEVNVIVCGINVGAQPYWNAEATMLMHTRGILIMTANGALVLTGKDALDYSVGEIFGVTSNPERKRPFDIRSVMRAVVDADHGVLERWANMRDAETVVVWDAFLGGFPVALLGIESRPVPRLVQGDADGPEAWTSGTLFPRSSKKAARAINAASGNRPLVVLANLSGFDGSPESMRNVQLEYGAEIGRAVTNFDGPIVFVVVSRYHGGAFVVFSKTLNENMQVVALE